MAAYPISWPLDAVYETVTYAAENLMNLLPEEHDLHKTMLDELANLHTTTPTRTQTTFRSVDRIYETSCHVIGAAMRNDCIHEWLPESRQHQAMLAYAVEYLRKYDYINHHYIKHKARPHCR
jgi:hypothetical protein